MNEDQACEIANAGPARYEDRDLGSGNGQLMDVVVPGASFTTHVVAILDRPPPYAPVGTES